jgi:hypothetical protein
MSDEVFSEVMTLYNKGRGQRDYPPDPLDWDKILAILNTLTGIEPIFHIKETDSGLLAVNSKFS